jgi:hypothetical protein
MSSKRKIADIDENKETKQKFKKNNNENVEKLVQTKLTFNKTSKLDINKAENEVKTEALQEKNNNKRKSPIVEPLRKESPKKTSKDDESLQVGPKLSPEKVDNENWLLSDYIEGEWKEALLDEFKKKYFIDINNKIRDGYKRDINRPPKELIFNAFNSTQLSDVINKFQSYF